MKKIVALCLLLSFAAGLLRIPAAAEEDPAVEFGCSTLQAVMPLGGQEQLLTSADGVILYELNTGTLVYAYEPDDRVNPSSMVKIMSALVALERGSLTDVVSVRRETLDSIPIGSVSAGLVRDEEVTLQDLLYCCLVGSANDATAVMAEHIAGSQSAFVDMMNERAVQLGCTDTLFSNVNGLSDNIQYSTARDLAIITAAALENETFTQMFCADNYTMPATNKSEARIIYTTNYMMSDEKIRNYYDARVTGGKTAAATHTKRSLICTAQIGTARYLSVVMSADSVMSEDNISVVSFGSFVETAQLLDHAQENYEVRQILEASQAFSQHPVTNGANDVVVSPVQDVFSVLPLTVEPEQLQLTTAFGTENLSAPVAAGTAVGTVRVSYGGIILTQCPLAAMFDVPQKGSVITPAAPITPEQNASPLQDALRWTLICVGVLAVLAGLAYVAARFIRNLRIRELYRKRKRNRRRSR